MANSRRLDLQQQLKQIEQAIPTLKKPEEKKLYEDQKGKIAQAISKIDEQIAESNVSLNESKTKLFSDDTDYANSIRSRIHMNKFLGTLSRDFSDKSSYVKYAENPLWKANMEEQKFAFDVKYKTASLEIEKRKAAAAEKANKLTEQQVTAYSTPGAMGGGMPPTKENVYQAYDGFIKNRQGNYNKLALAAFDNDAKKLEEYINVAVRGRFTDPVTGQSRNQTRDEVIQNIAVQEYTRIASVMNDKTGKYGSALKLNPVLVEAATQVSDLSNTISSMKATMDKIDKDTYAETGVTLEDMSVSKETLGRPLEIRMENPDGTAFSKTVNVTGQDMFDISEANLVEGYLGVRGWFASKEDEGKATRARKKLEVKYGKPVADGLIAQGGDLIKISLPVGEVKNNEKYINFDKRLNEKYNEVFSGFFPQNLGFVMNNKNRDIVVGKLNSVLYQNPLYTQDVRKDLLDDGSQVMFTSVPNPIGFGGTTYAAVITSKDGTESEPIPITSDQYSFLAGDQAPQVDINMTLTKARIYSSPDRSTNMQGVGSWQTSFFPGNMFTSNKGYNIGGMDLIQSTQNPNSFYPMLYVAPSGSTDYQTIPIQSSVSLSEGFNLPSILTDAKLKAMGINF